MRILFTFLFFISLVLVPLFMSRKSNRDSCPRKGGCPEAKVPHSKLMDHNVYEPGVLWAVFNPRSPRGKCNWSEQMKQESVCKRDSIKPGAGRLAQCGTDGIRDGPGTGNLRWKQQSPRAYLTLARVREPLSRLSEVIKALGK